MAGERLYAFSGHMLFSGIFYRGEFLVLFFFWKKNSTETQKALTAA